MNECNDINEICTCTWSHGVTVSTLDSESSDRGSNPRETFSLGHRRQRHEPFETWEERAQGERRHTCTWSHGVIVSTLDSESGDWRLWEWATLRKGGVVRPLVA